MLPPPAPMVATSIAGRSMSAPAIVTWWRSSGFPPVMTPTSKLVPPTSTVRMSSRPMARPIRWPATTPAAGPDSTAATGSRATSAAGTTPPAPVIT